MALGGDDQTTPEVTDPASPRPKSWFRSSWLAPWSPPCCFLFLFLIAAGSFLYVAKQVDPPDWVEVKIGPLPSGIKALFILIERSGRIGALSSYLSKVICDAPPANLFPEGILGSHDGNDPERLSVQWKRAERYGVLVRFEGRSDLLWWLRPDEIDRPALRWFFGSSRAEIRVPPIDRAEAPLDDLLDRLGLEHKFKQP